MGARYLRLINFVKLVIERAGVTQRGPLCGVLTKDLITYSYICRLHIRGQF